MPGPPEIPNHLVPALSAYAHQKLSSSVLASKASASRIAKAELFASRVGPLVRELQVSDMTMEAIVRELATRGMRTARGGTWTRVNARAAQG